MLRNFQRRNCCKKIIENGRDIVRPRGEVIIIFFQYDFCCDRIRWSAILKLLHRWRSSKAHCLAEKPSNCPFLSPLFLPLVRFREEQNFRNPEMCSISYFVIKRRSANHSWRPSSKAPRKKHQCGSRVSCLTQTSSLRLTKRCITLVPPPLCSS